MTRVSKIFVPGKLPSVTYNPRDSEELELQILDYVEETGAILTIAGPTKTGKTTLLRKVLTDPILLEGQGLESVEEMWMRIADHLHLEASRQDTTSEDSSEATRVGGNVNFMVGDAGGDSTTGTSRTSGSTRTFEYRSTVAMQKALELSGRPLVIDDFHFIPQRVQKAIVRTLKPLVLLGAPMIFVSVSHRVYEIVQAEMEMEGRVATIKIDFWSEDDLIQIAQKGFGELNLLDPDNELGARLASQAFGSPHLMQQFCRELCKTQGIREMQDEATVLSAPASWQDFFHAQIAGSSELWADRLIRGLQERGSARSKYSTDLGMKLDGYPLVLLAIARTGPKQTISKDEVRQKISEIVIGAGPGPNQTTAYLKNLSRIAAERLDAPDAIEGSGIEEESVEFQPVLDYTDSGPTSEIHIADPFFALYLACGFEPKLRAIAQEAQQ